MRLTNEYNLSTKHPDLAKEWHPTKNGELKPTEFTPGSDKKVWWFCEKGHEWPATIGDRSRGGGCPKCREERIGELVRRAALKKGSLAEKHPDLAKEWHKTKNGELTPSDVTPGSH